MAKQKSEMIRESRSLDAALEARFALDRRGLRLEAGILVAFLLVAWALYFGWHSEWRSFWPVHLWEWIALGLLLAAAPLYAFLSRWIPSRPRRVFHLDRELDVRGALIAAYELDPARSSKVGVLLRRRFARRLDRPLPPEAITGRRAARRRRFLRWAVFALLIWLLLQFLGFWLGPEGPVPRGMEGTLEGNRSAESSAPGVDGTSESASAAEMVGTGEAGASESDPLESEDPAAPEQGEGDVPPPPPEPERRLEDFFVRLREQASGGTERELWVVPLSAAEGAGDGETGNGNGEEEMSSEAPRSPFESAGIEQLRRAAERAALPTSLSERERKWVQDYFDALRKLP